MKRFTKSLSFLLAVLILLSSVMVLASVNVFAAGTITYNFTNSKAGYAQGKVTLKADNGTYWLYWADSTKALAGYSEVNKLTVSGGQGSFDMPAYTVIPVNAKNLIAIKSASEPSLSNCTVAKAAAVFAVPAGKQLGSKLLYTFGAISDVQLDNQSTGGYPNDETHFKAALETLAKRGVDFTVSSGDTVNDQDGPKSYAEEYKTYQRLIADSSYAAPIYEANGNHDVGSDWYNSNKNYDAPFIKATGLNSNKDTISAGKPYFEVTEPKTGDHFIFMALEGGFYTNKYEQFSSEQLSWLEELLKKYKGDGKNIFIIEHANVEGWGSGDRSSSPYYYNLGLKKDSKDVKKFIQLMETYKDCVIITGHTHLCLSAQLNYSDNNGTSAVMMHNSAIGGVRVPKSGVIETDRTPKLGLSEGYIVEVYKDFILFNGTNMYYNEVMPQCSYIIPMSTTENQGGNNNDTPTQPKPTTPVVSDNITITIKDTTNDGWMKNHADEREIQLIDNATGKKYVMTSKDGYKTWTVEVPRSVTNITFRRVNTTNNELRNQWDAGDRKGSVQYCVLDDTGGGTTKGNGNWNTSVLEPPKPVVTQPATKPITKPVVTEPKETTVVKPIVTEPKETPVVTKPVVTIPKDTVSTKPAVTDPKETPSVTKPTGTDVTVPTTVTAPVTDKLAPVVIVEKQEGTTLLVSAYAADGSENVEYQFAMNGVVYQQYSEASTFRCSVPYDYKYVIMVSVKYADGTEHTKDIAFEVKGGEVILPEMPEVPVKPTESTPVDVTKPSVSTTVADTVPTTSGIPAVTITIPETTVTESDPADEDYMYGDADLNSKVNIKDATQIQKYAAKILELDGVAFVQADVTGDFKVNVKDATAIQKYVAKIIDVFPVEEVALVTVSAGATAKQDLETYYTYSSYDQYMALKKAYKNSASQSEITKLQNALYDIVGTSGNSNITVYFTNTNDWSTVYAHVWGTAGDMATWPGTKMTYVRNNSSGKGIYKIDFDYDMYQKIIFTNHSEQTIDITLTGENNIGYYLNGSSNGKYNVTSYVYS